MEGKRHTPELHGSQDQNTHFQGPPQKILEVMESVECSGEGRDVYYKKVLSGDLTPSLRNPFFRIHFKLCHGIQAFLRLVLA